MSCPQFFPNLDQLAEKFNEYFTQRSKCRALDNYGGATGRTQTQWVSLIQQCMKEGFLNQEEALFLDYLIQRTGIDFLNWNVKTPWVKRQIRKLSAQAKANPTPKPVDLFSWRDSAKEVYIPYQTLTRQQRHA